MNKQNEYISLYEWLGRPAGKELGKLIMNKARERKTKTQYRLVDTPTYKGKIYLYKRGFLADLFREGIQTIK